jgi:hypothetical protein
LTNIERTWSALDQVREFPPEARRRSERWNLVQTPNQVPEGWLGPAS